MYAIRLRDLAQRSAFIDHLKSHGIHSVFHYVPLHSAPQGKRLGRCHGSLAVTEREAERLVRLPLWPGLDPYLERVLASIECFETEADFDNEECK